MIDSKYAWSYPFTWEDKMIYINEKYSILGRSLAARVNDIVDFRVYSYTAKDIEGIEVKGRFPMHPYSHNVFMRIRRDKVLLVAMRDIK